MKILYFIFIVLIFISLSCTKDDSNPVNSFDSLEGIWKSKGINGSDAPLVELGREVEYQFQNGNLKMIYKNYEFNNTLNNWVLKSYYNYFFNYTIDNNFLVLSEKDVPSVPYPVLLHYMLNDNKLTITQGNILKGNSNILKNTEWEYNFSFLFEREVEIYSIKEIFFENNKGITITNNLSRSTIDSVEFTYSAAGNELTISTPFSNNIYYFEVKDNKLYRWIKEGDDNNYFNVELFKESSVSPANNDFFPLQIGNSWTYAYYYVPGGVLREKKGTLKWTVIEEQNSNYKIQEIIEGIILSYNPPDTISFGPDTSYYYIEQEGVVLTMEPLLFNPGKIKFDRFYSLSEEQFLLRSFASSGLSQEIIMQKNIGVIQWNYGGSHNGAEFGKIILTDSNIYK